MTDVPRAGLRHAMADLLGGVGMIGAMMLMLFTLPVTLPIALLVGCIDDRRLRAVAIATRCNRCGTLLGPDAPAASDAAHIAALADMQRRYPLHLVRVGRRAQARCPACGADYVWDGRRRTLRLLADPMIAGDERVAEQAEEERRCMESRRTAWWCCPGRDMVR